MHAAHKAAPEKETPDQGDQAKNEKSRDSSYQNIDRKAKEAAESILLVWSDDIKQRRALLAEWFDLAKRNLTGRALKGACIAHDQFMVKTLSMHRDDEWIAKEYSCSERTVQRCFADMRDEGFGNCEAIKIKIGAVYRTTGRRVFLSLPAHLANARAATDGGASTKNDASTRMADASTHSSDAPTHSVHAATKTSDASTRVGASRPYERRPSKEDPTKEDNGRRPVYGQRILSDFLNGDLPPVGGELNQDTPHPSSEAYPDMKEKTFTLDDEEEEDDEDDEEPPPRSDRRDPYDWGD
ncbi:hypothetical protein EB235_19780 [Mesorhizobium loti R88b]|uniref:Uncharacterized protein n=2 Tax=Rhizobium loti TaxID=381 RepID=A0A6M7WPP7_RHILI|nr:hypothetical protein EB235_19780 [Mesorhizobium loti R88b]